MINRHFDVTTLDVVVYGDTTLSTSPPLTEFYVSTRVRLRPHNLQFNWAPLVLDIVDGDVEASIWKLTEDGIEPFDWETWGRPW